MRFDKMNYMNERVIERIFLENQETILKLKLIPSSYEIARTEHITVLRGIKDY